MSTTVARVESSAGRGRAGAPERPPRDRIAAVGLTAAYMAVVFRNFYDVPNPDHGSHFVAAGRFPSLWIFVGCVAWVRRPANPIGRWMIAVGFAGFLFVPILVTHPLSRTVGTFSRRPRSSSAPMCSWHSRMVASRIAPTGS